MGMTMPSRQIVVADDDVLTHWIVGEALIHAGHSVVSACRGAEVMALLDDAADFDLLLMETDLPDHCDGRRLADRWTAALPGRPVIYCGRPDAWAGRMLRPHEFFIAKPFGPAKLLHLVNWALANVVVGTQAVVLPRCASHVH